MDSDLLSGNRAHMELFGAFDHNSINDAIDHTNSDRQSAAQHSQQSENNRPGKLHFNTNKKTNKTLFNI